jgi:hypothetical protein
VIAARAVVVNMTSPGFMWAEPECEELGLFGAGQ